MEKHLYYYSNHTNYLADTNRSLPSVSYCDTQDEVHYNPFVEYIITATTRTEEDDYAIIIGIEKIEDEEIVDYYYDSFDEIRVDGVVVPIADIISNRGRISVDGEHTITYKLKSDSIGNNSFKNTRGIRSVIIPGGVTTIGSCCFEYSVELSQIILPNSVTSIGYNAFKGCGLSSIALPNNLTTINTYILSSCPLTSVTIPNGVTSIGWGAFSECRSLTSVTIPNSVTTINNCAFLGCEALENVIMSENVSLIKDAAFTGCVSLESFNLPNNVTIEDEVFCDCSSLSQSFRNLVLSKNQNALNCPYEG